MSAATSMSTVADMQHRIAQMQQYELGTHDRVLPTSPSIRELLGSDLRPGCSYSVIGSRTLALDILQAASASGEWCAILGMPDLGLEYAQQIGIQLDRLVLVPHLDERWTSVVATLAEAVSMVLVAPPRTPSPAEAHRIAPRLRTRGSALVAMTPWPGATATFTLASRQWNAAGAYLDDEQLSVITNVRGRPVQRNWKAQVPA